MSVIRHRFQTAEADQSDSSKLRPSDWGSTSTNYTLSPTHQLTGGALGSLLYRDTGATDGAGWLTPGGAGVPYWSGAGVAPVLSTTPTLTGTNFTGIPFAALSDNANIGRLDQAETVALMWTFTSGITLGASGILLGGTNLIEQRNGTNTQTFNIYSTFTSATNYERLSIGVWSGSRAAIFMNKGSGGGAYRDIDIQNNDAAAFRFTTAGAFQIIGSTGVLGYATGSGGTVTQGAGSGKATAVTLNKGTGQITMNNATLNAAAEVGFTLNNTTIAATDTIIVNVASGATADSYHVGVDAVGANSCRITLTNVSGSNLGEAIVLNFCVIKGASA